MKYLKLIEIELSFTSRFSTPKSSNQFWFSYFDFDCNKAQWKNLLSDCKSFRRLLTGKKKEEKTTKEVKKGGKK